jgi:putative endonuclease
VGRRGERIAARFLRRRGYRLLVRNLRTPRGEIDLLALDGRALVVVEVKTSRTRAGRLLEARLGRRQRERLVAAGRWLARRPSLRCYRPRVDLVTVSFVGRRSVVTIRRDLGR